MHNWRHARKIGSFYTHNYMGVVYIAKEQLTVDTVGSFFYLIYPNPITYSLRSFCLRQDQGKKSVEWTATVGWSLMSLFLQKIIYDIELIFE